MSNETDRELLELAAKAPGIVLDFSVRGDFPPYYVNERGGHSSWNPLTDDGDALRLAVKLGLDVQCIAKYRETQVFHYVGYVLEKWRDDPTVATRRAIVRAAAEIGRAME